MVEMGGLLQSAAASDRCGRETHHHRGPFIETKEVIGGYAVFELPSKDAAVEEARKFMELHRKHWPGWEGETEVRQVWAP